MSSALRCILCARVSTDDQAQHGTSLSAQIEAGRAKVEQIGGVVVGTCLEAGVSGALCDSRDKLQSALLQLEADEADALVWYDLTRLTRDIGHLIAITSRVEGLGKRLIYCTAEYEQSADGFIMQGIAGIFSHGERLKIRERTMRGRRKRAEAGVQPCRAISPYGYRLVTKDDALGSQYSREEIGAYVIIEAQAQVIREIFTRYQRGESLRAISRALMEANVKTIRGGTAWHSASLYYILKNPVYKGAPEFAAREYRTVERAGKKRHIITPGTAPVALTAPALVSADLWDRCQERLQSNRDRDSGRTDRKWMLSGLLKCPDCGATMTGNRYSGHLPKRLHGSKAGELPYEQRAQICNYRCKNSYLPVDSGSRCRSKINPKIETLERAVLEWVVKIASEPGRLREYIESKERAAERDSPDPKNRESLQAALNALLKRESAIVESQIRAIERGFSSQVYEDKLQELANQRRELEDQLRAVPAPVQPRFTKKQEEAFTKLLSGVESVLMAPYEQVSPLEKRALLVIIIEKIVPLSHDGTQFDVTLRL